MLPNVGSHKPAEAKGVGRFCGLPCWKQSPLLFAISAVLLKLLLVFVINISERYKEKDLSVIFF